MQDSALEARLAAVEQQLEVQIGGLSAAFASGAADGPDTSLSWAVRLLSIHKVSCPIYGVAYRVFGCALSRNVEASTD